METEKEPYKNIFDFVYKTLGYSPGGEYKDDLLVFHHSKISNEDFEKLSKVWKEYRNERPDTKLPDVKFGLSFGLTFEEEQLQLGLSPEIVGDTRFWKTEKEIKNEISA